MPCAALKLQSSFARQSREREREPISKRFYIYPLPIVHYMYNRRNASLCQSDVGYIRIQSFIHRIAADIVLLEAFYN